MKKHITKLKDLKDWMKAHYIISGIILIVVLFIGYKMFGGGAAKAEVFTVKKGDIVQKVIVNGKTKAVRDSKLAFEVNGTVESAYVDIGSRVFAGQALVALDQSGVYADLLKAKANLASEQARLDEMKKGARPEEIAVSETELKNAEVSYADASQNLIDKVKDIVNNDIDQLFSNPHSSNPQLTFVLSDQQLKANIEFGRLEMESLTSVSKTSLTGPEISKVTLFVENVAKAVNMLSANSNLSQTTLDGYKSDLSSARAALITAKETLNSADSAVALAQKNLSLKKSGSSAEAISAETAKVMQFDADVQSVQSRLGKMTLRSPQSGIVTMQDAKEGEIVTPGKVVVSVISDNDLEIESNVSEINIGKVSIDNQVNITFDAFPGQTFVGTVTYIEPAETVIDGVVNYKITVAFKEAYPQMKSGLTSKLEIITGTKTDVVVIPQYSISTVGNETFVLKQNGKEFTKVPVTVGLRGQDGFAEVVGGLNVGDVINTIAPAN